MKFKKILITFMLLFSITLCSCDTSNSNANNPLDNIEELMPNNNQNSSNAIEVPVINDNNSNEVLDESVSNNSDTEQIEQNKEAVNSLNIPYPNYSNKKYSSNTSLEEILIETTEYIVASSVMIYVETSNGTSLGSGVIYQKSNNSYYILTNDHVVDSGINYTITTNDNHQFKAELLGTSSTYDAAVLKFESTDSYNIISFEENEIKVASCVIAVGTPLSEKYINSVTIGNISKLLEGQILHTASINSGNSGGGLFNLKGNLIGLNNSKLSDETSNGASIDNMFFAISKDYIIKAIDEMNSPKLGITTVDVKNVRLISNCSNFYEAYYTCGISEESYNQFIVYSKYLLENVNEGLLIIDIIADSNAYSYLEIGDVLISVDTIKIDSVGNIKAILTSKKINDLITFKLYRNNELRTIEFNLLK